jgi:hypothetical protein
LYGDRRNNIDLRVAKIFRFGRTRTQVGVDVYNVTNSDAVNTYNNSYVPNGSWLVPSTIATARFAKITAQVDFQFRPGVLSEEPLVVLAALHLARIPADGLVFLPLSAEKYPVRLWLSKT